MMSMIEKVKRSQMVGQDYGGPGKKWINKREKVVSRNGKKTCLKKETKAYRGGRQGLNLW